MILHLFPIIFWTILATLAITPLAISAAVRFRLIDQPHSSPHNIHQLPVPKAGGLVVGIVVTSLGLLTYHRLVGLGLPPSRAVMTMHISAILCGCLAFIALPLPPLWANLIFATALLAGLFILAWFNKQN